MALLVMVRLSVAVPPGPVQVRVQVVEAPTVGLVMVLSIPLVPETLKPGPVPEQEVALVDVQCRLTLSPGMMVPSPVLQSSQTRFRRIFFCNEAVGAGVEGVLVIVKLSVASPPRPVQVRV